MSRQTSDAIITTLLAFAEQSLGHCYVYGGAPGTDGQSCWDCSSMQDYGFGVVAGLPIPGYAAGQYDGSVHGPSSLGWLDSIGTTVGTVHRDQAQAGDLACWQTHIGMCISNTEMISAANPTDGTIRSGIDGFIQGETLTILRHHAIGPGGIDLPIPVIGSSGDLNRVARSVAQETIGLVRAGMVLDRIARVGWKH